MTGDSRISANITSKINVTKQFHYSPATTTYIDGFTRTQTLSKAFIQETEVDVPTNKAGCMDVPPILRGIYNNERITEFL